MDCPEGLEHEDDECMLLNKTIYGLAQSARQFFKKLIQCLTSLGYEGGLIDPCLMVKRKGNEIAFVAIYVDDCLFIGHEKLINETILGIKKWGLEVKVENDLSDYLSCKIIFDKNKTKAWLGQPHLIKNLQNKFGDMVKNLQTYRTPGTPNQGITRLKKEETAGKLNEEDHSLYRSGVGMLLYLVKHSRPDIANAVRELSKVMDGPTPAAMKELKRVIKFVLDTKDYGLNMAPKSQEDNTKWTLQVYTDSDWAGDKDTRLSVSGYVLFLMGVPILWKSKSQKAIALSSSEAEYYALSEAAKDVKFVHMLLTTMGLKVNLPIEIKVDNVGAIFMTENVSTAGRTKHLDLRAKFVNKMAEEGFVKFNFVPSAKNKSDHLTKNVSGDIYEAHVNSFVMNKESIESAEQAEVCMIHTIEPKQKKIVKSKLKKILWKVVEGKQLNKASRKKWVDKVELKLGSIGVHNAKELVLNILDINQMLEENILNPLHKDTLKSLHYRGLEELVETTDPELILEFSDPMY